MIERHLATPRIDQHRRLLAYLDAMLSHKETVPPKLELLFLNPCSGVQFSLGSLHMAETQGIASRSLEPLRFRCP